MYHFPDKLNTLIPPLDLNQTTNQARTDLHPVHRDLSSRKVKELMQPLDPNENTKEAQINTFSDHIYSFSSREATVRIILFNFDQNT